MDIDNSTPIGGETYATFTEQSRQYGEAVVALRARAIVAEAALRLAHLADEIDNFAPPHRPAPPAWHAKMLPFTVVALWLALAAGAAAASPCEDPAAFDASLLQPYELGAVGFLYEVCRDHVPCSDAFYMRDARGSLLDTGRRSFQSLLPNALSVQGTRCHITDIAHPFESTLWPYYCTLGPLNDDQAVWLTATLWADCMTSGMLSRAVCDVNEAWIYDADSGTGRCACREDRDCREPPTSSTTEVVALTLFIVLAAVALLYYLVHIGYIFDTAGHALKHT
jgi:hypothetical protein